MPDDERYTLTELADLAGVTPRTVRYYLGQGLLAQVGQSGPGAKYGGDHLARLRLIRRLQGEHLPLAEIRRRLDRLDPAAIAELAGTEPPTPPADSALEYLQSLLAPLDQASGQAAHDPRPGHALLTRVDRALPATSQPAPDTAAATRVLRPAPGPAAPTMAPGGRPISLPGSPEGTEAPDATQAPDPDAPIVLAERLGDPYRPTVATVPAAPAPQTTDRSQWERIALTPDVELHIRRPLTRSLNKAVDRLITIARELLQEDPS